MDESKNTQNKYWLSLDQWRQSPEFKELADKEFMTSPLDEGTQGGWARRDFLKLMGASLALGSFGCVRRPIQKIVPYVKRPEGLIPGVSNFYASAMQDAGEVLSLVVRTREGRPIKLEGNEFFPEVGEALSSRGQATVLNLYDPDRLNGPKQNLLNKKRTNRDTISIDWRKADRDIFDNLEKGGVYVLSGHNSSKASRKLINKFVSKFGGEYFEWAPNSYEDFKKSFSDSFGESSNILPRYRISKANYILSIGTDFLESEYGALLNSREWGKARDVENREPVKLVQVESMMSLTGTNADQRIILKPSEYLSFLCAVIKEGGFSGAYASAASQFAGINKLSDEVKKYAKDVAKSLKTNSGRSIVMAFGTQSKSSDYLEIQKAAHFLNSALDNDGKTIDYSQAPFVSYTAKESAMDDLIKKAQSGSIKTLIIHGTNPLYTYHDNKKLREALSKIKTVVYTGDRNDETGAVSHYILPDDHTLEKWNEFESFKNVYVISQPTISPLYDTRAFEQSLLNWLREEKTWYDLVKEEWQERFSQNRSSSGFGKFEEFWVELLQKGVWDLSEFKNSAKSARAFSGSFNAKYKETKGLSLILYPSLVFGHGEYSNVSWLQELPDPVTKIVWDNYLNVSMDFAEKNHLKDGDVVEIKVGANKVELPVLIQPGHDSDSVSVKLGYGRKGAGKVADGVGQNVYPLSNGLSVLTDVGFKKTGKTYALANTQGHNYLEGRNLVAEASYNEYKEHESAGIHKHKVFSLWSKHKYTGHKWGMSIDLSKCTGCSSCVVACQSENNIPVVGKKHILDGREMHWIRIDRYYSGSPKAPRTLHQPVTCMHCDNAPCETVCPALATVHTDEGINDMVYNRCIGTRYCSNNCPYKVRRFNWFNYSKIKSPLNMALNPEVTVRSRGVMEKCSFCVHKIQEAKSKATIEKRKLKDGDVKPACELTCASKAIVFGDMNDKESAVSKKFARERTYQMLEELNVVPAVRYMSKIWNTEEKLVAHHGSGHGEEKTEGHEKQKAKHQDDSHQEEAH